ncbi:MAG: cobalamin biosynthesis protein [Oscillospiraceae bacterium]|nr:cobalamin biosynthesis protein [Oscillospiraceae bacterium]
MFVGRFLDAPYEKSRLYDPSFPTAYRRGGVAYLAFTERGRALAERLRSALGGEVSCTRDGVKLNDWTAAHFPTAKALVYVGAAGIAVRAVAPHLASKASDPAVLCVDEGGQFVIPLASGHLGGANAFTHEVANILGATAVITTATDGRGVFAVDEWARTQDCAVVGAEHIKRISAALLAGERVTFRSAFPIAGEPPEGVTPTDGEPDFWVDARPHAGLVVAPRCLTLGVGCKRGTARESLEARFREFCRANDILPQAIRAAASIDRKADEEGLLSFCAAHGWALKTYTAAELSAVAGDFSASAFVDAVTGVDNVCERAAVLASGGALLARKDAGDGVTFALARGDVHLDWRGNDA